MVGDYIFIADISNFGANLIFYVGVANPQFRMAVESEIAPTHAERSDMLIGFDALEQAAAFPSGAPGAKIYLDTAVEHLSKVANTESRNALANMLLSSAFFNLAHYHAKQGDKEKPIKQRALSTGYFF